MFKVSQYLRRELVMLALVVSASAAQLSAKDAPVTDMPLDRVADSYAIYQQVLPSNAIEWSEVPRTQWLLQDATIAPQCDAPAMMTLDKAIKVPAERKAEWDEVLADYAAHCHERYRLNGANFKLGLPVRLLDKEAQAHYWYGVQGFRRRNGDSIMAAPPTPDEFKGAAGLHSFSAVYFNHDHTLAAVYFGMVCGSLCGNWTWVALEKTPMGWKSQPWVRMRMMS